MAAITDFSPQIFDTTIATVAIGQTNSDVVDLYGTQVVGFVMPAALNSTSMKIKAVYSDGTSATLSKGGSDLSYTVAVDKHIVVTPEDLAGVRKIQLVMGTSESGGARSIKILTRPV